MCCGVYMRNFEGLVQGPMLVVAGGCEGLTPDITRWAGMLFCYMHVMWLYNGARSF
jgi:hypothetical protein